MNTRHKIYELFIRSKRLRFSDIEKALGIKSNTLAYHLDSLIKEGLLQKEDDNYLLTTHGESKIPFFTHTTETGVLPAVLAAIVKNDQVLLLKRKKRPYQGYWGLPSSTLKMEESLEESILKKVKEETGLDCTFSHVAAVIHERIKENDAYKHGFILFLTVVNPESMDAARESEEGTLEWFPLKTLQPGRIIPSDYHMLKDHLDGVTHVSCVIMEEKEEKLVKYEHTTTSTSSKSRQ